MNEYEKLMATARECGLKIISDDFCCKLLAWLYVFGAETEMVTYNVKLRTDIQEAQKRLNVFGGEIPDKKLAGKLRSYMKECGDYFKPSRPAWADEIEIRYGLNGCGGKE